MKIPHRLFPAAVATAAVAGLLGLAGCGVPIDREPRPINQTTVAPAETVPTTVAPSGAPVVDKPYSKERISKALADCLAEPYPLSSEAAAGAAVATS